MNNTSRTLIVTFFVFFLLFTGLAGAATSPESTCKEKDILFGFFNGVTNTPAKALSSLLELKKIHGVYTLRGEKIRYRVFYNNTEGLTDFVETFEQRAKERDGVLKGRYELFFDAIKGGGGSWWSSILKVLPSEQAVLVAMSSAQLLAAQKTNTELNYRFHKDTIDAAVKNGTKLLFVAHSQGNLFANAAYKYAITAITKNGIKPIGGVYIAPESMIHMVHIAPASIETHGPVILADGDLVINGLRLLGGSVPSITHYIEDYLLRPAGINGERDWKGHGLLEIYINQKMPIAKSVKSAIDSELNDLNPPPCGMEFLFKSTVTCNDPRDHIQYSKTLHYLRAGYHHDIFGQIIVNVRAVGTFADETHHQVISGVTKSLTVTSDTIKPFPWYYHAGAWVKYDFEKKSVTASFKYSKDFTDSNIQVCNETEPVLVWARSVEEVERTDYIYGSPRIW